MSDRPISHTVIRQTLLEQAHLRGSEKSICPSEVARELGGEQWRNLMPMVREVGTDLVDEGSIIVLQKGKPVDPRCAKGPIRYRIVEAEGDRP